MFSGLSRVPTVPAGSAENAALVGAKTVNGPLALEGVDQAGRLHRGHERGVATMSLLGYIACPPTIGPLLARTAAGRTASALSTTNAIVRFISSILSG